MNQTADEKGRVRLQAAGQVCFATGTGRPEADSGLLKVEVVTVDLMRIQQMWSAKECALIDGELGAFSIGRYASTVRHRLLLD